jgi:ParB family transcriptional regulator, chromosome partitioning protein
MTSAQFQSVSTSAIIVDRDERQRSDLEDVDVLADSIRRLGLIHPLVVTRELVLVSGERRLTAVKSLGWSHVTIQFQDECDAYLLHAIELEENVKRRELPWQDECKAVQEYHQLRAAEEAKWTLEDTAEALGLTQPEASARITVAKELADPKSMIHAAPRYTTAVNMTRRTAERKAAAELDKVLDLVEPDRPKDMILNTSFLKWAPEYRGPLFNFIHCDFPYGINAHKFGSAFVGGHVHGDYEDTKENYIELIKCLLGNLDKIMSDSGHLLFWFSMTHYHETFELLSSEFFVDAYPLVWHKSDNAGNAPRPQHMARRVYETAFFCSRGDHPIVKIASNLFSASTVSDRHMSEKPVTMLTHFFKMLVDGHTAMLDPTAGSGSALRAAKRLGATRIMGLEINEQFARDANKALTEDTME